VINFETSSSGNSTARHVALVKFESVKKKIHQKAVNKLQTKSIFEKFQIDQNLSECIK
jgi:hypothetical protein